MPTAYYNVKIFNGQPWKTLSELSNPFYGVQSSIHIFLKRSKEVSIFNKKVAKDQLQHLTYRMRRSVIK